jgi:hypothetical protein
MKDIITKYCKELRLGNSRKLPGYTSNNKRRIPGQITETGSTKQTLDKEK